MSDISNLRHTIVPKSDQLNSEQLMGAPMTVTVAGVKLGGTDEQPLIVHYADDNGRPYKPCKTMRKVLIFAWGEDGRDWVGRSMTLYNDPTVRFGGAQVGGIRISHMSHIEREIGLSLTATKGKKAAHTIKPLVISEKPAGKVGKDESPQATAQRIKAGVSAGDAAGAAEAMSLWPADRLDAVWSLLDAPTQDKLTAAWPKEAA